MGARARLAGLVLAVACVGSAGAQDEEEPPLALTAPKPFDLREALTKLAQYDHEHPGFLEVPRRACPETRGARRICGAGAGGRRVWRPPSAPVRAHDRPRAALWVRSRRAHAGPSPPHVHAAQGVAAWIAIGAVLYLVALVLLLYSEIRTCLIVRDQVPACLRAAPCCASSPEPARLRRVCVCARMHVRMHVCACACACACACVYMHPRAALTRRLAQDFRKRLLETQCFQPGVGTHAHTRARTHTHTHTHTHTKTR
jgi:hypothetical protein